MKDGFKVIDADRHILEPSELYQNYLPEKFKNRVRLGGPNQTVREVDGKPVSDSAQRPGRAMEDFGYIFSSSKRWRECFADAYANKFDPASNLRDMDREGIDVSVLFPTIGLYIMWRDDIDPELSAAICRAYNTWLADYCDHDRKRLYGVMLLPLQDPARAVAELKHAREKLGLVGIFWDVNVGSVAKVFAGSGELLDQAFVRRTDKFLGELLWMAKTLRHGRENIPLR